MPEPDWKKQRQSCRHKGTAWLRARGQRAGRVSAIKRLQRITQQANRFHSKTRAFIKGYECGYRAAYKRHYNYWRTRMAHAQKQVS